MNDIINNEKLINYYKNKRLLIVGLNDSQGVNTTSTFFKKGLLEYLAAALTSEQSTPQVINAFSLTMNKTEHIDYFLKHNISLEEIKLSQIYSVIAALEKVMQDIHMPKFLGKVGNAYRLIYTPKKGDENIKLSSSLKEAEEPILIYSSGVNNLMREVGSNPFAIKSQYKDRDKNPNYNYTLQKSQNPKSLKTVIDSIDKNFYNLLSLNNKIDIYTLGAYIPKSLQSKEMDIFRDLVIKYNEELIKLCKEYGITFVNTEEVGKKYNNSENNFHISTKGHNALANYILNCIYNNKFVDKKQTKNIVNTFEFNNNSIQGIINEISNDCMNSLSKYSSESNFQKNREYSIYQEHLREEDVFQKILIKKFKKSI